MANYRNHHSNIGVVRELLSPYLDDEVTTEERVLIEQTLATSPELTQELESLRLTVAQLTALPRVPAPRPFTLSEADIQSVKSKWKGFFGFPLWFGGLATVATTLICLFALSWVMVGQQLNPQGAASEVAQSNQATTEVAVSAAVEQVQAVVTEEALAEAQEIEADLAQESEITAQKSVTAAEALDTAAPGPATAAPASEAVGQATIAQPETQALMQSNADGLPESEIDNDTTVKETTVTSIMPGTRTVLTEAAASAPQEPTQNEAAPQLESPLAMTSTERALATPPQDSPSSEYTVPRRPLWLVLLGGIALATFIATGLIGWFILQNKRR